MEPFAYMIPMECMEVVIFLKIFLIIQLKFWLDIKNAKGSVWYFTR
jgi:hypothetical protein